MKGPWVAGTGLAALLAGVLLASAPLGVAGVGDRPMQAIRDLPPAPALELPDDEGRKTWRLADLRGKVVLVNFWATWCPPCRKELPSMERLWRQFGSQGLVVLGVNVGESSDVVYAFNQGLETPLSFPLLLDETTAAAKSWPVKGLPTTFLVDRQGRLAFGAIGGREFDGPAIVAQVRELLAAP